MLGVLCVCLVRVDKFSQVLLVLSKSHVRGCATYCAPVRSRPLWKITKRPCRGTAHSITGLSAPQPTSQVGFMERLKYTCLHRRI